VAKEIFD